MTALGMELHVHAKGSECSQSGDLAKPITAFLLEDQFAYVAGFCLGRGKGAGKELGWKAGEMQEERRYTGKWS